MARRSTTPALWILCFAVIAFVLWGCFVLQSPVQQLRLLAANAYGRHERGDFESHAIVQGDYLLGVGKADITGPVVEINLMGYADTDQAGSDTAVRHGILQGLRDLGPEYEVYNKDNVAVTGTHSHSGPGAWLNYLLPQLTSLGFNKQSYDAIVNGSILAIRRAHESLRPGFLSFGHQEIVDGNINRSPFAYLQNPKCERAKYTADVDKNLTLLKFQRASDNQTLGILSWFPVHGTSLYQNNTLITGDNKGVAAYLLEESEKSSKGFIAGFSQANVGDTSPNTLGPFCEDTGLACSFNDSTCGGRSEPCHGRGSFFRAEDQGTKSCFDIGKRQMTAARQLLDSDNLERIPSSIVSSFHTYANLSSFSFISPLNESRTLKTCSAALGYGFAGGTTDGPGRFDFSQGTNDTDDSPSLKNPLWKIARTALHPPSDEQIECQRPKPILLDVGNANEPYAWSPNIVDIQLLRIGPLLVIISSGEATTMSGRRWKSALASAAPSILKIEDPKVVLGGPANTYAHYIATEEEYSVQRYEGASTLYGPHTLAAYLNLTLSYLPYLGSELETFHLDPLPPGPSPPINTNRSLSFIRPVVVDNAGLFRKFGDILSSPDPATPHRPGETVSAKFVGANPRNNLHLEGTFASVEFFNESRNAWVQVRSDRDWFLVYTWKRTSTVLGTSEVTLEWEIEPGTATGMYRFRYVGDSKALTGRITAFEGISGVFHVVDDTQGELIRT